MQCDHGLSHKVQQERGRMKENSEISPANIAEYSFFIYAKEMELDGEMHSHRDDKIRAI